MERKVTIRQWCGMWQWCCTLCQPAAFGATTSYEKTLRNVHRHCTRSRVVHHAWVAKHR